MESELYNTIKNRNNKSLNQLKEKNGKHQKFMFKNTDFKNKTINSLQLDGGQFHGCDFTVSKIGGCKFDNCEFIKCKFNSVDFLGVKFTNCTIDNCDFTQAKLSDVLMNDNIITSNNFDKVDIVGGVTINGQDIVDAKQLSMIVGDDNTDNIIADEVDPEQQKQMVESILDQFKCLQKKEDGSYEISDGAVTFLIAQDEGGWREMFCYNKDGETNPEEDQFISNLLDLEEDQNLTSKIEIVEQIKQLAKSMGEEAKQKIKTDFVKKSIDMIVKKINDCNVNYMKD